MCMCWASGVAQVVEYLPTKCVCLCTQYKVSKYMKLKSGRIERRSKIYLQPSSFSD
jgi:hypothetical protein